MTAMPGTDIISNLLICKVYLCIPMFSLAKLRGQGEGIGGQRLFIVIGIPARSAPNAVSR